jgi:hypothetical protein
MVHSNKKSSQYVVGYEINLGYSELLVYSNMCSTVRLQVTPHHEILYFSERGGLPCCRMGHRIIFILCSFEKFEEEISRIYHSKIVKFCYLLSVYSVDLFVNIVCISSSFVQSECN